MSNSNMDIRLKAIEKGIPLWKIAKHLGMSESGFSRKMRNELSNEEKEKVFRAIEQIKKGA